MTLKAKLAGNDSSDARNLLAIVDSLVRRGPRLILAVNSLVDAGNHHCRVAGVLAGGEDGVPEPGAVGQAGLGGEIGLGLAKGAIELGQIAGGSQLQAADALSRGGESRCGSLRWAEVQRKALVSGFLFGGFNIRC